MKLSVIIPFFSELNLIRRTVESVVVNSYLFTEVEIILINDGIIDESKIRGYLSSELNKLIIISPNRYKKGPGGARNTGLEISSGDFIAFLDADDFWLPGKLEAQMLEIKKGASFVTTSYRFNVGKTVILPPKNIKTPNDIFLKRGIGTSTVLITKQLLENNRFNEIRFGQDIDFWFNLSKSKNFNYVRVPEVFVEYNTGGSTKNKWVQLFYVNRVLSMNKIDISTRIKFNISYIISGIYNHYIKNLFFKKN